MKLTCELAEQLTQGGLKEITKLLSESVSNKQFKLIEAELQLIMLKL
jgi:hypothetical protein